MKKKTKLLLIISILLFLTSNLSSEAPSWVPPDKVKSYEYVIEKATEYSQVLKSDFKIVDGERDGKYLILKVQRGHLVGLLKVGEFDSEVSWTLKEDKVIIYYLEEEKSWYERRSFWAVCGFATGILVYSIIFFVL